VRLPGPTAARTLHSSCDPGRRRHRPARRSARRLRRGVVEAPGGPGRLQRERCLDPRPPAAELDPRHADRPPRLRAARPARCARLGGGGRPRGRGVVDALARQADLHLHDPRGRPLVERRAGHERALPLRLAPRDAARHRLGLRRDVPVHRGRRRVLRLARRAARGDGAGRERPRRRAGALGRDAGGIRPDRGPLDARRAHAGGHAPRARPVLSRPRGLRGLLPGLPPAGRAVRAARPRDRAPRPPPGLDAPARDRLQRPVRGDRLEVQADDAPRAEPPLLEPRGAACALDRGPVDRRPERRDPRVPHRGDRPVRRGVRALPRRDRAGQAGVPRRARRRGGTPARLGAGPLRGRRRAARGPAEERAHRPGVRDLLLELQLLGPLADGRPNPFADARVRRAFALVVDKRSISEQVRRMGEPTTGVLIPPGSIGGYEARGACPTSGTRRPTRRRRRSSIGPARCWRRRAIPIRRATSRSPSSCSSTRTRGTT
jgi:hypothetical protein